MLVLSVEFLFGTFRGDPDGTANTGQRTKGEWPPAPSRLFAALVAADGTGQRCRVTDGSELRWLERLPAPLIYADPNVCNQPLHPRYVVRHSGTWARDNKTKGKAKGVKTHQEYIARSGALFRPGVRVSVRNPQVVYRWDVEVPDEVLESLRRRAARVGYLGTADSPARLRFETRMPQSIPEHVFEPDSHGDLALGVPRPGDVRILDQVYEQWRDRGASVARSQFPALQHEALYRSPGPITSPAPGEVIAWLRLGRAVSGRRVTALTALFKEAVLSQHQRIHGDPPAVLHGHGFTERGYEIARFLALSDAGYPNSRGRIHGLALWMPQNSGDSIRRRARDAAFSIRRLTGQGVDVPVAPREDENQPLAANPKRWLARSRLWATAFPAIHERHCTLDLQELSRWCQHAGLPDPVAFRSGRTPFVTGAADLAPVEVNRPGRPGLPYSHVELEFAEAVAGPVVIGGGRQRGFGLCVPLNDSTALG